MDKNGAGILISGHLFWMDWKDLKRWICWIGYFELNSFGWILFWDDEDKDDDEYSRIRIRTTWE